MLTDSIRYFNSKLIKGSSSYTILGDLNLPDICWASSDGGCDYSKLFLEVIEDHSLMPLVYEPTHRSGNTLDIILTSHTELFTAVVNEKLYSDHFPLFAFFTIPEAAPTVCDIRPECEKCNLCRIRIFSSEPSGLVIIKN